MCVCGVYTKQHTISLLGGSIFEEGGSKPKIALLDTDDLFLTTDTQQPAQTGDLDMEDNSEILK